LNNQAKKITELLREDYRNGRDIDAKNTVSGLCRDEIVRVMLQIRNLIFPAFGKGCACEDVENGLEDRVFETLCLLSDQIALSLKYLPENKGKDEGDILERGKEKAIAFMEKLPSIRELLQGDLISAYEGDPAAFSTEEIMLCYPGMFAITVNRIAHELYVLNVPILPRIMTEYAHSQTGIDIHPGATIGKRFFIDHGTGTVIGETSVIGDNVKIYQGVTIGALSTRGGQKLNGKKRHPTIEDDVTVYAGASILGGETVIGKGSVIGANAFITSSVEAGSKISFKKN